MTGPKEPKLHDLKDRAGVQNLKEKAKKKGMASEGEPDLRERGDEVGGACAIRSCVMEMKELFEDPQRELVETAFVQGLNHQTLKP